MSEENLDIRKVIASYLGIVYRAIAYWKWGITLCVLITAAGTIYAASLKKEFESRTTIRVTRTQVRSPGEFGDEDIGEMLKGELNNFVRVADAHLQKIIDTHRLYQEEKVQKALTDREVRALMREKIYTNVQEGGMFSITFVDYNPETAQKVTQALAESFVSTQKGEDYEHYQRQLQAKEEELAMLEAELDKMMDYETRFRETNASLIKKLREQAIPMPVASPAESEVSDDTRGTRYDSPQLRKLRNRLRTLEETAVRIRNKGNNNTATAALAARRTTANDRVNQAKRRYDELRRQYTEQWPDVRTAKAQLQQAQAEYRSLDAQYREAQRRDSAPSAELVGIQNQINQTRDEVQRMARREIALRQSNPTKGADSEEEESPEPTRVASRETDLIPLKTVEEVASELDRIKTTQQPLKEQVQQAYIDRHRLKSQAKLREQGMFDFDTIDEAHLPQKASGPARAKYAVASAAGGVAIGMGLMLLLGFIDSRVYRPSDLNRLDQIPLLVTVPDFERDVAEISAASPQNPADQHVEGPSSRVVG